MAERTGSRSGAARRVRGSVDWRWRTLIVTGCAVAFIGCSVDDHRLNTLRIDWLDPVGEAGAGGDASVDQSAPECGEGGASGDRGMLGCWTFDSDVDGWQTEPGVEQALSSEDVNGDAQSGSLSVTNNDVGRDDVLLNAGVFRCLPATEGTIYELTVSVLIPAQLHAGGASVELDFSNAPACEGLRVEQRSFPVAEALTWQRIDESGRVPRDSRSLLLRLAVGKNHRAPTFSARFDDLSVLAH